jgi:cysteinyl-tRNA synthetase
MRSQTAATTQVAWSPVLELFDTARGAVVPLRTREPGMVTIYVCGPTVYGPPHLGHGRSGLVYDILRRYLEWDGYQVTFVSNITDIDDKIIERAQKEGRDSADIAVRCERIWWQAMDAIDVRRPDHIPHATAYVEEMVDLIGRLIDIGRAYVTDDGVYLSVESVEGYGLLARQSLEEMRAGGGDREVIGEGKRHPADFALWKLAKPGEPTWPSPWGAGRPGWHTECVVMSLGILGEGFDLHTGGMDLQFPHHENERAQAVALGKRFANHWMHHAFVVDAEGEKMSKSLGNFANLLDLVESVDPRSYRMLILQSHYRSPLRVDRSTIEPAERAVERLDALARRAGGSAPAGEPDGAVLAAFRSKMEADLDTPGAMAVVFDAVTRANAALDAGDAATGGALAAAVFELCAAVGLRLEGAEEAPPDITALAQARQTARAAKDWAEADRLRAELTAQGWLVEDTASGPLLRRA